ncbi:MAG: hypothetical protein HYT77_01685 [Deltaproteobacteria bacterium]|nr:hypothetical protein [Deltaproteobacteria bacterium]
MEGFLCQIEADISLASDAEVQGDVDNLEHVDLSDLTGSCTEINLL